ncbi:hypothetical protein Nmel_002994, partial [Mimus melanotis]
PSPPAVIVSGDGKRRGGGGGSAGLVRLSRRRPGAGSAPRPCLGPGPCRRGAAAFPVTLVPFPSCLGLSPRVEGPRQSPAGLTAVLFIPPGRSRLDPLGLCEVAECLPYFPPDTQDFLSRSFLCVRPPPLLDLCLKS